MKSACVLGGSGTIGHQLISHLKERGYWVRSVDINHPKYSPTLADEFLIKDLRDEMSTRLAMLPYDGRIEFDYVFMLAAQMGGAEYIFSKDNDSDIIYDSAKMNLNVARSATRFGIKKLFFSSSACIYPECLQSGENGDMKESEAWAGKPDSAYGIEKLFSESMYDAFKRNNDLNIRIARFHNIFSEECHYSDKRAKAPAAICYKVSKAKNGDAIEIFGDGNQKRSFLYIDEAIDGVMRLMESDYTGPVNIGSDEQITINNLAKMVIAISGKDLGIKNIKGPEGVRSRNSDNTLIKQVLGWTPTQPLIEGMVNLYNWVNAQVNGY